MTEGVTRGRKWQGVVAGLGLGLSCLPAFGTDIIGVLPAALDQPRINVIIRPTTGGGPYVYDDAYEEDVKSFNIDPAYLDTGASGVLLSGDVTSFLQNSTTGATGIPYQTYNGRPVIYEDVGVNGSERFFVSQPVNISLAHYHPDTDNKIIASRDQYNATGTFNGVDLSYYNHHLNNVRATITPPTPDGGETSATGPLNVIGMPAMKNKVVVMDPKPVNTLLDTMRTYVYDRNTPFNPAKADSDPGIPRTTRTVKLSYGSFDQFTQTGTVDAANNFTPIPQGDLAANIPVLDHNPFIGPNPVNPAGDSTPPVKVGFNGRTAEGSFLLDTGAAASMISSDIAGQLAVRYRSGTQGTESPTLESYNPANPSAPGTELQDQFRIDVGGVGGVSRISGFFLSSLLVRTMEGNAANDLDPKHFRFLDAPVFVVDIKLKDPNSTTALTLDGIFGMNFLIASTLIEYTDIGGGIVLPLPVLLSHGAFDFAVFDEAAGELKLRPRLNGDANRDGKVDFDDLLAVAQHYNQQPSTDDPYTSGDFNGDGEVNFDDLLILAQHYNLDDLLDADTVTLPQYPFDLFGSPTAAAATPEPTGGLLLGLAAAPLLRRRRRSSAVAS